MNVSFLMIKMKNSNSALLCSIYRIDIMFKIEYISWVKSEMCEHCFIVSWVGLIRIMFERKNLEGHVDDPEFFLFFCIRIRENDFLIRKTLEESIEWFIDSCRSYKSIPCIDQYRFSTSELLEIFEGKRQEIILSKRRDRDMMA